MQSNVGPQSAALPLVLFHMAEKRLPVDERASPAGPSLRAAETVSDMGDNTLTQRRDQGQTGECGGAGKNGFPLERYGWLLADPLRLCRMWHDGEFTK